MLNLSGHEAVTTQAVGEEPLAWQGRLWRSTCECGWTSRDHFHPIDATMEMADHAVRVASARSLDEPTA